MARLDARMALVGLASQDQAPYGVQIPPAFDKARGQLIEQKAANDAEAIAELEKRIVVSEKQVIASESRKKGQLSNIEKIVAGRVDKFFADACLLEQPFFRDPDKKVSDLLTEAKAKVGEEVSIVRFVRFQVGETAAE